MTSRPATDPIAACTRTRAVFLTCAVRRVAGRARRAVGGDEGSAVVELFFLALVFLSLLLFVGGFNLLTNAQQLVAQAAGAAARAAANTLTPAQASTAADQAARDSVLNAGRSCAGLHVAVDTSTFHPGGQVSVTVACTVDLSGLGAVKLPLHQTVQSTQAAPIETYR